VRRALLLSFAALCLAAPAAEAAQICATGSAAEAAVALYGSGSEVTSTDRVAGLSTALALEPRIAPGTRRRMIDAGGRWCDATTGFNHAWKDGDRRAMAGAYASLAAAPYFDQVTVESIDETLPGTFAITTHARTNGVEATWVVVTDAEGVRSARWTATRFAQEPFTAEIEGLTALPGLSERYTRVAGGALEAARGLPTASSARAAATAAGEQPGLGVEYVGPDGFRIVISYGDGRVAPQLGQDTGVRAIDVIRQVQRSTKENYEEFFAWGMSKGWQPAELAGEKDTGYVYINDALSAACLACVFIANDFQIHISSEVNTALTALGYRYTDPQRAFSNVIGHEMFHNFQNRYVQPGTIGHAITGGRRGNTSTAYSEGTARFQETLHDYSEVSHQTQSLVYAQDSNGCNGFDGRGTSANMDNAMASGVFGKTYNSCYFWMPFYAEHGKDALLELITTAMPAVSPERDVHKEGIAAVTAATGESFLELQQRFAVSALTARGNVWGPFNGGEALDWSKYLEPWKPTMLAVPGTSERTLTNGGMMAHRLTARTARVSLSGPDAAVLFVVRDDGTTASVESLKPGGRVNGPRAGERVFVLAVHPEAGGGAVSMRFTK
jgi:hypothetical protein